MALAASPPTSKTPTAEWFTATIEPGGRVVMAGELDMNSLDALRAALEQALLEPGRVVSIDAAELSFIDSTALTELLHYQLIAATRQRDLVLESVSPPVAKVLDLLDLRHLLMG